MVPTVSLWLPILVSGVVVFIASSIMHMVLPLHRSDMRKVPREDELLDAFRRINVPPGDYGVPHPGSMAETRSPEFRAKVQAGPVLMLTVAPGGRMSMAPQLTLWFIYCLVVSVFAAYIAGHALPPAGARGEVVRFAGCTAFLGYSLALAQHSIWYRRSWATTFKSMFDGLVYGFLTGAVFAWLWPR